MWVKKRNHPVDAEDAKNVSPEYEKNVAKKIRACIFPLPVTHAVHYIRVNVHAHKMSTQALCSWSFHFKSA